MRTAPTAVLDLRERPSWDVQRLLAPTPEQIWGQATLISVSGLAQALTPYTEAEAEEPVVSPGSVDVLTGDVTTRRGRGAHRAVLRVGTAPGSARVGDVLVPVLGDGPGVFVGQSHRALSFVNFVSLQTDDRTVALWLWAALSSTRGMALRRALSVGLTARLPLRELLAAPVPTPPPASDERYAFIAQLQSHTRVSGSSEGRSWWRVTALPPGGQWQRFLATPTPEVFDRGIPLGELGEIVAGRNPRDRFDQPRPGLLPVLNGRSLTGERVYGWAEPTLGLTAEPGDVAVVEVGTRGNAAVVASRALTGSGVLLIKPRDRRYAEAIAAYLRSEPAQAIRATLITGLIPRLTRKELAQLPIPNEVLVWPPQDGSSTATTLPLSEQLERLLWA